MGWCFTTRRSLSRRDDGLAPSPLRTLRDCATAHLSPELLHDATHDALERGLVTHDELELIQIALKSFGGL